MQILFLLVVRRMAVEDKVNEYTVSVKQAPQGKPKGGCLGACLIQVTLDLFLLWNLKI